MVEERNGDCSEIIVRCSQRGHLVFRYNSDSNNYSERFSP